MKKIKHRLDTVLVERGLAENKSKAQGLIMAGEVSVNGRVLTKAGDLVSANAKIELAGKLPYVSRGGLKLEHALDEFKIDINDRICLDVGASTGGFTDFSPSVRAKAAISETVSPLTAR